MSNILNHNVIIFCSTYIYISEKVTKQLEDLENTFGHSAISKLGTLISCTEYGLTETEYLELLMPTSNIEGFISLDEANFNFSSLCSVRIEMG